MDVLYALRGTVIKGKKRGKLLGFPTANINLNKDIPDGIYVSIVIVDNKEYLAATFIGAAKTFYEVKKQAESYLLNFDKNIYGKEIIIKLYNKLRDNKKFLSEDELVKQITIDVENVKSFFKHNDQKPF
jgi:riboflavin kinase/FMN adenylyltransferase